MKTTALLSAILLAAASVGTGAASAAPVLPVHDLLTGRPPVEYALFQPSTVGLPVSRVSRATGMRDVPPAGQTDLTRIWMPYRAGASMSLTDVGAWRTPDGGRHVMDARLTVLGYHDMGVGAIPDDGASNILFSNNIPGLQPSGRAWITIRMDFTAEDGADVSGLKGMIGFVDLDTDEGVTLDSGFNGAWVRGDSRLAHPDANTWEGLDESPNGSGGMNGEEGVRHYVIGTFDGPSAAFTYFNVDGSCRGMPLMRLLPSIGYPLVYHPNGGTGTLPRYEEEGR